ncbi:hypothetical protein pb186bvf_002076 [Paramecium bursaria]
MDIKNYNGWRFCPYCQNLLKPYHGANEKLSFKCRSNRCGDNGIIEAIIDAESLHDSLLLKKDYQAAKAIDITDTTLILDPSMPRKRVTCQKYSKSCLQFRCDFNEAIYFLKTDKNEKQIIIQYICARKDPKICGNMWRQSDQNEELSFM